MGYTAVTNIYRCVTLTTWQEVSQKQFLPKRHGVHTLAMTGVKAIYLTTGSCLHLNHTQVCCRLENSST